MNITKKQESKRQGLVVITGLFCEFAHSRLNCPSSASRFFSVHPILYL